MLAPTTPYVPPPAHADSAVVGHMWSASDSLVEVAHNNPLCDFSNGINWKDLKPKHFDKALHYWANIGAQQVDSVLAIPANERTFENTVLALKRAAAGLDQASQIAYWLDRVEPGFSDANQTANTITADFRTRSFYTPAVLSALTDLHTRDTHQLGLLTSDESWVLSQMIIKIENGGGAVRDSLPRIVLEANGAVLDSIQKAFTDNVAADIKAHPFVLSISEAAGLPDDLIKKGLEASKAMGLSSDTLVFASNQQGYSSLISYLINPEARAKVHEIYNLHGLRGNDHDNTDLIARHIQLSNQRAGLLGFTYSEWRLRGTMAGSQANVEAALDEIDRKTRPLAEKEAAELWEFRKSLEGADAAKPTDADVPYYQRLLKAKQYALDDAALKPYLNADSVFAHVAGYLAKHLDLKLDRSKDSAPWGDSNVMVYSVSRSNGEQLGQVVVDLWAREGKGPVGKLSGGWVTSGKLGSNEPHVAAIIGNWNRGADGSSPHLSIDNVASLFHEFGHTLEFMVRRPALDGLPPTDVPSDFVELPATALQTVALKPAVLRELLVHESTGEPIGDSLLIAINRAQSFPRAGRTLSLVGLARLDIALSHYNPATNGPLDAFSRGILQYHSKFELPPCVNQVGKWDQVMRGPSHDYPYDLLIGTSYVLPQARANEIAAKLESGDSAQWIRFRDSLLAAAGTRPPDRMVREFLQPTNRILGYSSNHAVLRPASKKRGNPR